MAAPKSSLAHTKSVLPGDAQSCTFRNSFETFNLHANLVDWQDTRKPRIAVHEFIKRDGAKTELMGRAPHVIKMNLFYVGENWVRSFQNLAAAVDRDPNGQLVHPALGAMLVTCQGFEGASVNVEHAVDMYTVPVSFIENNFDAIVPFTEEKTLATTTQDIKVGCDSLDELAATFVSGANYISTYTSAAVSFADAIFSSSSTSTLDASLSRQLSAVHKASLDARAAVLADSAATSLAVTYAPLLAIEQVYASCVEAERAAIRAKSQPFLYTVPTPMHIAVIATKFYGKDGRGRINEILANNPGRVPNPALVTQGTVLVLAPPTNLNASE